jgi:peptide/nickel transport system ATP-binding protein
MSAALAEPHATPLAAIQPPVVSVDDLAISFFPSEGSEVSVVRGVSFEMRAGEVVGVVGESGSGKSLTGRSILGLVPNGAHVTGSVRVNGAEVLAMSETQLRSLRGREVAMFFQDPMTSFNPVRRIGKQIAEAIRVHRWLPRLKVRERVIRALDQVGIINPSRTANAFPHEFSGGMRQRAMIAMGLVNDPGIIVADEPTTALDVTVQDQVLNLMRDVNRERNTAILLITHNIAVVANICSRVLVMYAGRIVEDGPAAQVLRNPQHPYTSLLLRSVPRIDRRSDRLIGIEGQPPDPANLPSGCKFRNRCPLAQNVCATVEPELDRLGAEHLVRCHFPLNTTDRKQRCVA